MPLGRGVSNTNTVHLSQRRVRHPEQLSPCNARLNERRTLQFPLHMYKSSKDCYIHLDIY
ncbi:hypothetical protein C7B67_01280 [filamentous cyanobacterium Phorm 6]|nr:hypothetical protein C7B67_01280 [filamentous cyanobacterium Phorm 6]